MGRGVPGVSRYGRRGQGILVVSWCGGREGVPVVSWQERWVSQNCLGMEGKKGVLNVP